MKLMFFVLRTCRGMLVFTAIAAGLSGACNALLMAMVNAGVNRAGTVAAGFVGAFAALVLGKFATSFVSQVLLIRYSQQIIADLRRDLVSRVLNVPLRRLEEIGAPRVMVALTDDVVNITQALLGIPIIGVNLAILAGGAVYLAWLSWKMLLLLAVFVLLGGVSYRLCIRSAFRYLNHAREVEDKLFGGFRGLTEGIKELKLHRNRREAFLAENIRDTTRDFQRYNVMAETRFILAQNWTHLLFFVLIGVLLFLLPSIEPTSPQALTGYVITMLYLMGPLGGVLAYVSLYGRGDVALKKVEQIGLSLQEKASDAAPLTPMTEQPAFERIELRGVTHSYRRESEDDHFVLGPMDLEFRPGELVFLVGGNGSGKSTLAKIIAGLYVPEQGEIRVDGRLVDGAGRDDYRQMFSTVFFDFYLFDSLLGIDMENVDARAREYLERLHLRNKVQVRDGRLSTTALSQGQRKRLALLTAYLEDRPFYLFDEWASDQDPLFKEIFYTQLLPELKHRGKCVLAITHDEKYFHLADRLWKLDYGKLVENLAPHHLADGLNGREKPRPRPRGAAPVLPRMGEPAA